MLKHYMPSTAVNNLITLMGLFDKQKGAINLIQYRAIKNSSRKRISVRNLAVLVNTSHFCLRNRPIDCCRHSSHSAAQGAVERSLMIGMDQFVINILVCVRRQVLKNYATLPAIAAPGSLTVPGFAIFTRFSQIYLQLTILKAVAV